eukprot:TRINITY_DN41272_c0_g1_i1.p1 TRINITY_DN41272_c0_g1~~TRINITY_DN41272_c0_g1_i1.p1  ORF type:complete len:1160 (-),score=170.43 TRINITY_DN41272_c0_g1_i1:2416-5895(-)
MGVQRLRLRQLCQQTGMLALLLVLAGSPADGGRQTNEDTQQAGQNQQIQVTGGLAHLAKHKAAAATTEACCMRGGCGAQEEDGHASCHRYLTHAATCRRCTSEGAAEREDRCGRGAESTWAGGRHAKHQDAPEGDRRFGPAEDCAATDRGSASRHLGQDRESQADSQGGRREPRRCGEKVRDGRGDRHQAERGLQAVARADATEADLPGCRGLTGCRSTDPWYHEPCETRCPTADGDAQPDPRVGQDQQPRRAAAAGAPNSSSTKGAADGPCGRRRRWQRTAGDGSGRGQRSEEAWRSYLVFRAREVQDSEEYMQQLQERAQKALRDNEGLLSNTDSITDALTYVEDTQHLYPHDTDWVPARPLSVSANCMKLVDKYGLPVDTTNTLPTRTVEVELGLEELPAREFNGRMRLRSEFLAIPGLLPCTIEEISRLRPTASITATAQISDYYIFTDCSAGDMRNDLNEMESYPAGWAMAIITMHENGERGRYAYAAGLVNEHYEQDAFTAEATTVTFALQWVRELIATEDRTTRIIGVHVLADCLAALKIMQGSSTLGCKRNIAYIAQYLLKCIEMHMPLYCGHTRAHSRHPWNEFVDAASKTVRRTSTLQMNTLTTHVADLYNDINMRMRPWETSAERRGVPTVDPTRKTNVKLPHVVADDKVITDGLTSTRQRQRQPSRLAELQLDIASVKVTSALDRVRGEETQVGLNVQGRTAALRKTFLDRGLAIISLQESRTRRPMDRHNDDFLVKTSGCKPGSGALLGCGLWVRRKWVDEAGAEYDIGHNALVMSDYSTRHLFASLIHAAATFDIMVCHAPCRQNNGEEVRNFWLDMVRIAKARRRPHTPLVALFDANDTPSYDPPHVGTVLEQREEIPHMHIFLRELGLFSPYAARGIGQDDAPRPTCFNINMHASCIDFVALPMEWHTVTLNAMVDEEADVSLSIVNHLLVGARIMLPPKPTSITRSRRTLPYDATKAEAPEAAAKVAKILERLPEVAWEVDVTTHVHILNKHILFALSKEFPTDHRRATPDWMSDSTAMLLRQKARVYKDTIQLRKAGHEVPRSLRNLHRALANRLRAATRRERAEEIARTQANIAYAFDQNEVRIAWAKIKRLQPYRPRPTMLLRNDAGERARDADENAAFMLTHWADKLEGEVINAAEMV